MASWRRVGLACQLSLRCKLIFLGRTLQRRRRDAFAGHGNLHFVEVTRPDKRLMLRRHVTIFLHGGQDYICPTGESERMYLALRLLGVESKLVIFPDENHNFDARASSYPERSRLVLEWFDQHLGR